MRAAAFLAVLLLLATGCGSTSYVDSSRPGQEAATALGWHAVKPVSVTLPSSDPLADGDVDAAKPVIVNVWASFCVPCKKELPLLQRLSTSGEVQVVGLSRDSKRSAAAEALEDAGVTYPNLMDPDAKFAVALDGRIPLAQVPASALLVGGRVVAVHLGEFKSRAEVLEGLGFAGG